MPVGAFGGKRDIMEKIAPLGPVYQAGTLSGNPVAVAAGLATLARDRRRRDSTTRLARAHARSSPTGSRDAARRAGVAVLGEGGRRHVRPLFRGDGARHLRRGDGVRQGALQPLLPSRCSTPACISRRAHSRRDSSRRRTPRRTSTRRSRSPSGLRRRPLSGLARRLREAQSSPPARTTSARAVSDRRLGAITAFAVRRHGPSRQSRAVGDALLAAGDRGVAFRRRLRLRKRTQTLDSCGEKGDRPRFAVL